MEISGATLLLAQQPVNCGIEHSPPGNPRIAAARRRRPAVSVRTPPRIDPGASGRVHQRAQL